MEQLLRLQRTNKFPDHTVQQLQDFQRYAQNYQDQLQGLGALSP